MQALESLALEFVGYIPTWRNKNRLILSEIANRLNSQGVPSKADKSEASECSRQIINIWAPGDLWSDWIAGCQQGYRDAQ